MRRKSHLRRTGKTRGFVLHYRHLGVNQRKMDRWIREYHEQLSSIISKGTRGRAFNIFMGTRAIARGDYKPDRAWDLTGVAAYDREKKKYMKDLGLASKDDLITQRLLSHIKTLMEGGDTVSVIREYGMRMKLQSPQATWRAFKPGYRQVGYSHYRIRPLTMFLYAVKSGNERNSEVNTDDITLSAFRYFTPWECSLIDESFLMGYIDAYFDRKLRGRINYQNEFKQLFKKVEEELGSELTHPYAFEQKCRNTGNEIYCTSLFLRYIGVISIKETIPRHWSCTQMSYNRTGPAGYGIFSLTPIGEKELKNALARIPIWGKDIRDTFSNNWANGVNIINLFSKDRKVPKTDISEDMIPLFSSLGIKLKETKAGYKTVKIPDFDLQYDLG